MSIQNQDSEYLNFILDVIRNAMLREGETFEKAQLVAIGRNENMHPFEIDKAKSLAQEHGWIEIPRGKEIVVTKAGVDAANLNH
jgi:hypothetical protein